MLDSNRLFQLSGLKKPKKSVLSHAVVLISEAAMSIYNRHRHFLLLKSAEEILVQNLYSEVDYYIKYMEIFDTLSVASPSYIDNSTA